MTMLGSIHIVCVLSLFDYCSILAPECSKMRVMSKRSQRTCSKTNAVTKSAILLMNNIGAPLKQHLEKQQQHKESSQCCFDVSMIWHHNPTKKLKLPKKNMRPREIRGKSFHGRSIFQTSPQFLNQNATIPRYS
jgi:hypothetical protein